MDFDPVILARLQFAFTISFHIIFPAFTIGLSAYIAVLLGMWIKTGRERYQKLARFWTKIFAVSFGMGVVSGIVLSYQFGTNWSEFSRILGNVLGPLIGYEVLTAFFLEATFLGVLLFGWGRVPRWLQLTAAIAVAVGTLMSAFWILSANSWMHTPAGFEMRDGVAYPLDWLQIIFNPSFPYRFAHMLLAAYMTTAVVVLAVAARYRMADKFPRQSPTMLKMALGMIMLLAPLQLFIGDLHGLNTAEYQPAKVAAMEAHWDSSKPAPLLLFAWPDQEAQTNQLEIGIPNLASMIVTHDPEGLFPGLNDFSREDQPPVLPVFFAFRIMVGIGLLLILISAVGGFLWWRGRLLDSKWFLRPLQHVWPLGFIAILAGWMTTEIGRQPWLAHGVLRTADAASPVSANSILVSLILFVLVYGVVFSAGIYYINRLIGKGPEPEVLETPQVPATGRPLSAAESGHFEDLNREQQDNKKTHKGGAE